VASNPSRPANRPASDIVEAVGTLLGVGTIAVVALVALGTLLALAAGRRPIVDHGPALDPAALVPDIVALRPEGFLWLGLVLTVTLPAARVLFALLGFVRLRDVRAASVAVAVLCVLALSVAVALFSGSSL
jgi:uncharacterized membrane protein